MRSRDRPYKPVKMAEARTLTTAIEDAFVSLWEEKSCLYDTCSDRNSYSYAEQSAIRIVLS